MVRRPTFFMLSAALLLAPLTARAQEVIVPAGTTLQCTLEDATLSSKTTAKGDPVLCDVGGLREFGVTVFPRGAYLEGRFSDYRNPGHLWGKGWMQLDFDRILMPGAELPLSTKVTSATHLKVDASGKIHGTGHATRDAVEWAIPVLWPEKVLTLPMRGPRPTLKNEARLTLKLMQDLSVPQAIAGLGTSGRLLRPGAFRPSYRDGRPEMDTPVQPVSSTLPPMPPNPPTGPAIHEASIMLKPRTDRAASEGTLLMLKDGSGQLVKNYWFDSGQFVRFVTADGTSGRLAIENLDLSTTIKINRERGVPFIISSEYGAR